MTTREVLAKATQSLSASQVLANQNQDEIRKIQEELDFELRKQATNSVSKTDFNEHTKKVLEYMAVVKGNAELNRDKVKLEMQKFQKQFGANEAQQEQQRDDVKKMKAELIEQQQAMQTGLETDIQRLTKDMLRLANKMNNIDEEKDGLSEHVNGLTTNMDVLRTDTGTVAGHVESLGTKTERQNQKLQQNLTKEMQGLFADFKTSITGAMKSDTQADGNTARTPPAPRNVRYASSTQYQTQVNDTTGAADRTSDSKYMAEMVHGIMEASNDRLHKIVEILQATQSPLQADGSGMKAKPHKYGGEATDGSVDAWISLMRMYLEDCRGPERTKVLTLLTFLHRHAQAWIMQKPENERDSCEKVFMLLSSDLALENLPMMYAYNLMSENRKQVKSWILSWIILKLCGLKQHPGSRSRLVTWK